MKTLFLFHDAAGALRDKALYAADLVDELNIRVHNVLKVQGPGEKEPHSYMVQKIERGAVYEKTGAVNEVHLFPHGKPAYTVH